MLPPRSVVCAATIAGAGIEQVAIARPGNARAVLVNRFVGQGLRGDAFPFSAVVESEHAENDPLLLAAAFSGIDRERSRTFTCQPNVILPGSGAVKLVILSRRSPDLSVAEYHRHWLDLHAPLVMSRQGFSSYLRGYVQNHIAEGSWRSLSGLLPSVEVPYDGMMQMWFDSKEDMFAAFRSDDYRSVIRSDEPAFVAQGKSTSFLAIEQSSEISL